MHARQHSIIYRFQTRNDGTVDAAHTARTANAGHSWRVTRGLYATRAGVPAGVAAEHGNQFHARALADDS